MTDAIGPGLVRRAVSELFNRGDLSVAEEIYAPAYAEKERRFTQLARSAFPDLRLVIEQQVAADDLVATRWRATGTQDGAFLGIAPTHRPVSWTGIWLHRVDGGRIVEGDGWGVWDRAGLLEQLQEQAA